MTEPPIAPDDPPFGPDTDEAVSAHLDGELAGFAADHGLAAEEARQRLEAWPGYAERAAELGRARRELAPVAPLDEVTRRRLVQAARPELPASAPTGARWGRALAWVGGAAAAAALVVGVGVMVTRDRGGDASQAGTAAGGGAAEAPTPPAGALGDLGDVTDPARLRALLGETDEMTEAASGDATTRAPATSGAAADQRAANEDRALRADAFAACAAEIAGGAPVRFTATGTFQARPVVVVGVSRDGRTIVFVVPPDDCSQVLSSVSR